MGGVEGGVCVNGDVCIKIRSPASAETDHFYCLEAPGSPRAAPTGCAHGLPGVSRQ